MKKVNSFEELTTNQEILYKFNGKNENNWFGHYLGRKNQRYYFDITDCSDGYKIKQHHIRKDFFDKKPLMWEIFKITKKELENYELKIVVEKL